jgi:hypothetical protein
MRLFCRIAVLYLIVGFVASISPAIDVAPVPSVEPDTVRPHHVTLEGWDRRTRMAVWDRIHAVGGFYYDRGVLRRWTAQMDHEYDLDNFSIKPTLADDAVFYASDRGFRTAAGSITNGSFVIESELQTTETLIGPLGIDVRFVQQEDLSAERAFVELGYHVDLGKGHRIGARHSFASLKTDLDAELVYRYSHPNLDAELSAGRLDIANNLVNAVLVPDPVHFDTLRVYQTPPYWFAGRVSVPVGPVRCEAVGGVATESRADVRSQTVEQARFRYDNAFAFWGGLVEAEVIRDRLVVGAMASQSQSDAARRTPPDVIASSNYDSRQTQLRGGVFALANWTSLRAEAWWMHERVADRQWGSAFAGSTVDKPYGIEERWDWTRVRLDWVPGSRWGPTIGAEYAHGLRNYPVEGDLEEIQNEVLRFFPYGPNRRVTLRAGFRFSPRAEVVFGVNGDLDGDTFYNDGGRPFDGAHVRIRVVG